MWRNRFRSTSTAKPHCGSVASVDGHIFVHPWRSQRPVRFHFNHSTASWEGIHRDHPFLSSAGHVGTPLADINYDSHRHALTSVLAIDDAQWTFCAVDAINRNLIDESSAVLAHPPTM